MNPAFASRASIAFACSILLLAGCGGGGGGGGTGKLVPNISLAQADWIIVDLTSGKATGSKTRPNLASDQYRTTHMVFVALPSGNVAGGSPPATRWGLADEVPGNVGSSRVFISVFETTRGQWQRLATTTPWTRLSGDLLGANDERLPASGLSKDLAEAGCATGSSRCAGSFRLPTGSEWEYACRAGSTARFSWGNAIDSATVAIHAQVAETAGVNPGPARVGQRTENAYHLFDVHGGVWEICSDGALRGGSWRDSLPMARAANRIAIDTTTPHALAGVRLVYIPDGK